MARIIREATRFEQCNGVGDLSLQHTPGGVNWGGTASSLAADYGGDGQEVDSPNNLNWQDVAGAIYGQSRSCGVRVRFRLKASSTATPIVVINTNQTNFEVGANSSNRYYISGVLSSGSPSTTTSTVASDLTDHRLEVWTAIDNSSGAFRVVLDGVELTQLTATGRDTQSTGDRCVGVTFNSTNLVIAEPIIMFESGIFTNSHFLESGTREARYRILKPNAAGTYNAFTNTTGGGGDRYLEVDDLPHDGTTTRLTAVGFGDKQSVGLENFVVSTLSAAQILVLRSTISERNFAANHQLTSFIRASGTDYSGANTGNASWTGFTHRTEMWQTELATSVGWASMDVDDAATAINAYELGGESTNAAWFAPEITSMSFGVVYLTGSTSAMGVIVRGTMANDGTLTRGYIGYIERSPLDEYTAFIRRHNGGFTRDLASANVATGYGLARDTEFELAVSIENVDGASEATGTPSVTMFIGTVQVSGFDALVGSAIVTDEDAVLDTSPSGQILSGSAQGLYLVPPADTSDGLLRYRLWGSGEPAGGGDEGDDEQEPSFVLGAECDGKVGALATPLGWTFTVTQGSRVAEHRFETGHVARLRFDRRFRRVWEFDTPPLTDDERDDLWEFWDAHGKQVPFDFTDPEDGTVMCAHFADDALETQFLAPGVHGYKFRVEELFDDAVTHVYQPGVAVLRITPRAPRILTFTPGTAQLVLRPKNPLITSMFKPGTKTLTITRNAPTKV